MLGLEKFLTRFKQSLDKDTAVKETVILCIKEKLGFELKTEEISVKGGVLRIQTSPAKRNEINLHQEELLSIIRERTGFALTSISY